MTIMESQKIVYKSGLGWNYTQTDLERMERVIKKSKEYMANYGKGDKVAIVDISHYANRTTLKQK